MALFHTTVLDNQIKALPTVDTASGSIATFDTDLTENLVEVKCQIVAKQASGTPSPDNPLPITVYTSLNLSHSGSDTSNPTVYNIPFGQNVANGVLDITTGNLRVDRGYGIIDENSPIIVNDTYEHQFGVRVNDWGIKLSIESAKMCNIYQIGTYTPAVSRPNLKLDSYSGMFSGQNGYFIVWRDDSCTTLADVQAILSNTPMQIVFELATPIEIQLDSITLQALLNENNIWCDTGDTEVKFLLTVGKKIS